jgi:hypothetical protein
MLIMHRTELVTENANRLRQITLQLLLEEILKGKEDALNKTVL